MNGLELTLKQYIESLEGSIKKCDEMHLGMSDETREHNLGKMYAFEEVKEYLEFLLR